MPDSTTHEHVRRTTFAIVGASAALAMICTAAIAMETANDVPAPSRVTGSGMTLGADGHDGDSTVNTGNRFCPTDSQGATIWQEMTFSDGRAPLVKR